MFEGIDEAPQCGCEHPWILQPLHLRTISELYKARARWLLNSQCEEGSSQIPEEQWALSDLGAFKRGTWYPREEKAFPPCPKGLFSKQRDSKNRGSHTWICVLYRAVAAMQVCSEHSFALSHKQSCRVVITTWSQLPVWELPISAWLKNKSQLV